MLEKNQKVYLIFLVTSALILIFTALYFTNRCPKCAETFSKDEQKSVIVYQISNR